MTAALFISALLPLLAISAPGLVLLAIPDWRRRPPLELFARTLAGSFVIISLVSLASPFLLLSRAQLLLLACAAGIVTAARYARAASRLVPYLGIFIALYILFSIPYLAVHNALPSGDIQKSILWAQRLPADAFTPDYRASMALLNRDPVDFYTPALHAVTNAVMNATPVPLSAAGFFAIALSLTAASIAAALAASISSRPRAAAALAAVFVLTNLRFLRYVREPGYHFQNIAGEVLLWAMLLLLIALIKRYRTADLVLLTAAAIVLVLTHQFTAFLATFVIGAALLAAAITARRRIGILLRAHMSALTAAAAVALFALLLGLALNLGEKLPHLFTAVPHLLPQTPDLADYPQLVGWPWLLLGVSGLVYLLRSRLPDKRAAASRCAVAAAILVLLILSQAPRLFIDIPPVRALFYAIVPASIAAAILTIEVLPYLARRRPRDRAAILRGWHVLAAPAAGLLIGASLYQSAAGAFALSHTVRTNSTLLPGYLPLINAVQQQPGPVLVDDYNRRSASWLVLAGQPMYTRIAADLERQMEEARQSEQRYQLYLAQLDYEKIIALGSLPEIQALLDKHGIRYITGIKNSSATSLSHNPLLKAVADGGDVTLFETSNNEADQVSSDNDGSPAGDAAGVPQPPDQRDRRLGVQRRQDPQAEQSKAISPWLLRASTLANDIGDAEDTFKHLPASLRATRLSAHQQQGSTTYRTTAAPLIPLVFNVGDFVRILWDKEHTGQPDTSVELLIRTTPPMPIEIITPAGTVLSGRSGELLKIPAAAVPFDTQGFITLMLVNEQEQPISIDLIALGLARTP